MRQRLYPGTVGKAGRIGVFVVEGCRDKNLGQSPLAEQSSRQLVVIHAKAFLLQRRHCQTLLAGGQQDIGVLVGEQRSHRLWPADRW